MNLTNEKPLSLNQILALSITLGLSASAAQISVDSSFQSPLPAGSAIQALTVQGSALFAAGEFQNSLAVMNSAGTLNSTVQVSVDGSIFAVAPSSSGQIYIGGSFNFVDGALSRNIARLTPSGALDSSFNLHIGSNGRVEALALQNDGKILLGGSFNYVSGENRTYLARLNADGTLDNSFVPAFESSLVIEAGVTAVTLQTDGRILVGGIFDIAGQQRTLVRLQEDGAIDPSFEAAEGNTLYVNQITAGTDGSIYVCGMADPFARGFLRKLQVDGSVDDTFSEITTEGPINAFVIQSSGHLVLGGDFSSLNGEAASNLARVTGQGIVDEAFLLVTDGAVTSLVINTSEEIYLAGEFTQIGRTRAERMAKLIQTMDHQVSLSAGNGSKPFRGNISGIAGKTYRVETSTDLTNWAPIGVRVATSAGIEIVDNRSSQTTHRFFRASLVD